MSDLVYNKGASFMIGTGIGFSISNSFRLLDKSDNLPIGMGYSDAYPLGFG